MHGRRTLPTGTTQPAVDTQHLSIRQRLRNDWASQNIAQPMINGKVVDRKRSGDSNGEDGSPQSSKRRRVNSTTVEERGVSNEVAEIKVQQAQVRQDSGNSTNVVNKDAKKPGVRLTLEQYRELRGVQNGMERNNDGRTNQRRDVSHGNWMEQPQARQDSGNSTNVVNKDAEKPGVRLTLEQYRELRGVQNGMERNNDGRTYQRREFAHGNMMEKTEAKKQYYTNSPYMSPKEMTEGYPDDGTAAVPYETLMKLNPADPLDLKRMIWNYYMLP